MIRILYISAALLVISAVEVFGQNDSTQYINGLPVTEDDTARQVLQSTDLEPKNQLTAVQANALPEKLRKVLDSEEQFSGWRDTAVYFEKNTRLYHVPLRYAEGVKIFGLSENGDPVTFREVGHGDAP